MPRVARTVARLVPVALLGSLLSACELVYPEVAVVNLADEQILIKDVSFNGCVWDEVLAYGEATPPGRCLPGEDKIHFKRLNTATYCQEQAEDETAPNWFNYQTVSVKQAGHDGFHLFEISLDDMEQDFSVPGPYGH